MKKHVEQKPFENIETTIGELIEIVTQIALEAGKTEEEGYRLASLALESLLKKNTKDLSTLVLN